jgi:hypothetical protein
VFFCVVLVFYPVIEENMLSVDITGIDHSRNNLKLNPEKVRNALLQSGFLVEASAKRLITELKAVDTGRLRASISTASDTEKAELRNPVDNSKSSDVVSQPRKGSGDVSVVRVGTSVEYAPFIVFGTRSMSPRDFLTPAVHMNLSRIKSLLVSSLQ